MTPLIEYGKVDGELGGCKVKRYVPDILAP